jgi:curved DNA-binding protein CbpA
VKDYYSILRVSRSADSKTIKHSYRLLVQKYHPDINPDAQAAELIKEINEAYDVLSDPAKKSDYDYKLISPSQHIPVSQPTPHRDPRYRRSTTRRAPSSDYYTQEELMQQYLPYMLWLCRVGILFIVVLFSDKVLPPQTIVDDITDIYKVYRGKSRTYTYDVVETSSGMSIKMYYHGATYFNEQSKIKVEITPILRIATSVSGQDGANKISVGIIYGTFLFFPILLLSTSVFGILFRKKIGFSFSLSILSGVLLIFNLYFI